MRRLAVLLALALLLTGCGGSKADYQQISQDEAYRMMQEETVVVLDVREQAFFTENGFADQHAGGQAFAHQAEVMGWLFGEH